MKQFQRFITLIGLSSIILFFSVITGIPAVINLPQTGQVTCYNTAGTAITCADTGQDGDIRAGVPWPIPRFVDNSDGTISDTLTGLMWLKDAGCFLESWQGALTKLADLNTHPENSACTNYTATYNDWRLSNILELESLPNEEVPNSAAWLDAQGFSHVNNGGMAILSSTNVVWWGTNIWGFDAQWRYLQGYSGVIGGSFSMNYLPVRLGQQGSPNPNYPANVWRTGQTVCFDESRNIISCIGTGQDGEALRGVTWPDPRFTDNSNGTVTDNLTGLIWLKDMTCLGAPSWQGALNVITGFNSNPGNYICQDYVAAFNDWRLPNRKELLSLVDFSQSYVALPTGYSSIFANVDGYGIWSSTSCTPATHGADYAWQLYLSIGEFHPHIKTESGYLAWAVRGGPTGSANFADISVTKTDSPDPVVVSQPLTYTITVTNNGPDQANGVSLTDNLPTGVTFVSASSDQGTCSQLNGIVTCTIGSITNSAHVTVTINVLAPSQSGTFTNRASVTSTSVDLYSVNDTATIYTTVSGPVNLPQTGQATSYHSGDDGAIRTGVVPPNPRFTIVYCNASGPCPNQASDCDSNASTDLITDNLTGLVWARDGNIANTEHGGAWLFAMQHAQNVTNAGNGLCGYKDWRVPNINELLGLGINSSLNSQGFVRVQSYNYWSSTTSPWDTGQTLVAQAQYSWQVAKSDFMYHQYIPVRGGTNLPAQVWRTGQTTSFTTGDDGSIKAGIPWPTPRFANTNGSTPVTGDVVLDNLTGLMWTKNANLPNTLLNWNGGLDYIANMNSGAGYGGFTDWRLPNYIELRSLWDLSQNPALPSGHSFTNLSDVYWSSSTNPDNVNEAFCAGFNSILAGNIGVNGKTESRWIWPVRGGFIPPPVSSSLYTAFTGYGLWKYEAGSWSQLNTRDPVSIAVSGSTLYATFSTYGLWKYEAGAWSQLNTRDPANIAVSGSTLYSIFNGYGLWKYEAGSWSQLNTRDPVSIAVSGSTLYATFSTYGLWKYEAGSWSQLNTRDPVSIAVSGSTLYATFSTYGLWKYEAGSWSQLNTRDPVSIAVSGSTLYATFSTYGLWKYEAGSWSQLNTRDPVNIAVSDTTLYSIFNGYGLWKYDSGTWSLLNTRDPINMRVGGDS